jgi:AcrR family transcriptional regulator
MAASGLTRTVFYRHFRSLSEVVLNLLEDLITGIQATPNTTGLTGPELLRHQLQMVVETYEVHGPVLVALERAASEDPEAARAFTTWCERAVAVSVKLLEKGVDQGMTPSMPVQDVARALHAMNRAYLAELVTSEAGIDRDRAVEALWTVWVRTTLRDPDSVVL